MASEKELIQESKQVRAEEQKLLDMLSELDREIQLAESEHVELQNKAKGIIKEIRTLDSDYSHFIIF